MKKEQLKQAASAVETVATVWRASETYTLENVRLCGATALAVSAGYLLRLAKLDAKCTRRDERRAVVPIATQTHAAIWRLACDYTAALPADTDKAKWADVVCELVKAGTAVAKKRADDARKARANKKGEAKAAKGEGEGAEEDTGEAKAAKGEDPRLVITLSTATLIAALWKLPLEERAPAARKVCAEISNRFE